ncbi:nickel-dependent hydrogenase large subunit [Motiliproteus sediminis]|uniref:nickel-dependent hydrogenase large subunit n=1 Tax=Motiliproteus sediminis TaxID=1468178 RepID=UPI001AEF57E0|nr:nickel-dependent hydrogenase large subunit [Motiliproteus sediminis]
MSIAGKISVVLQHNAEVEIRSSRPLQLTASLRGFAAAEIIQRVPALYALCGRAQALAAHRALQAAGALAPSDRQSGERAAAVEAVLEGIWRFAIDLPQWAGVSLSMAPFARLRHALLQDESEASGELLNQYLTTQLLGEAPAQWASADGEAMLHWLYHSDAPAAGLLREVEAVLLGVGGAAAAVTTPLLACPSDEQLCEIAHAMKTDSYLAAPQWRGACVETGARAYQQDHSWFANDSVMALPQALQRLLARLLELVSLVRHLTGNGVALPVSGGLPLSDGDGVGWVRTARGVLLHYAAAERDRVSDYRILAPTEWNFHPKGVLARAVSPWNTVPPSMRQRWLALQVMSLDPCVAYELEVYDA